MADTKLSDLETATAVDYLYGISGGVSKKVALTALKAADAATAEGNGSAVAIAAGGGGATSGDGGEVHITGGAGGPTGIGGAVVIHSGVAGAGNTGGPIDIRSFGAATVTLLAGDADAASDFGGGAIAISSGAGDTTGPGGAIEIATGTGGATGQGGALSLSAGGGGATSGDGGAVSITAGSATDGDGNGGNITLTPGAKDGTGVAGHFILALEEFADDAAAATGGVPVNGWYRTASAVKVRVS